MGQEHHLRIGGLATLSGLAPDAVRYYWGIDAGVRVGEFSIEQSAYLDHRRVNVFKHELLER